MYVKIKTTNKSILKASTELMKKKPTGAAGGKCVDCPCPTQLSYHIELTGT